MIKKVDVMSFGIARLDGLILVKGVVKVVWELGLMSDSENLLHKVKQM